MRSKTVNLWLDDIRDPTKHGAIGYVWAKDVPEAIKIMTHCTVNHCSLDHDLTLSQTMGSDDGEPTGYTLLEWMRDNNCWPKQMPTVHSLNPIGGARMQAFIWKYWRAQP